jgi:hypothetical protein
MDEHQYTSLGRTARLELEKVRISGTSALAMPGRPPRVRAARAGDEG